VESKPLLQKDALANEPETGKNIEAEIAESTENIVGGEVLADKSDQTVKPLSRNQKRWQKKKQAKIEERKAQQAAQAPAESKEQDDSKKAEITENKIAGEVVAGKSNQTVNPLSRNQKRWQNKKKANFNRDNSKPVDGADSSQEAKANPNSNNVDTKPDSRMSSKDPNLSDNKIFDKKPEIPQGKEISDNKSVDPSTIINKKYMHSQDLKIAGRRPEKNSAEYQNKEEKAKEQHSEKVETIPTKKNVQQPQKNKKPAAQKKQAKNAAKPDSRMSSKDPNLSDNKKFDKKPEIPQGKEISDNKSVDPSTIINKKYLHSQDMKIDGRRPEKNSAEYQNKEEKAKEQHKEKVAKAPANKDLQQPKEEKKVVADTKQVKDVAEPTPKQNAKPALKTEAKPFPPKNKNEFKVFPYSKMNINYLYDPSDELNPEIERMHKVVENFLNKVAMIDEEDNLLCGVSGGVDSIVMLDILANLAPKMKFNLIVCHYNHKLREVSSDSDEQFVKNTTRKYKLSFFSSSGNVRQFAEVSSYSIEQAARSLRYKFFDRAARLVRANFVATAHNKDEAAETFFINLFRGSGITGLSGIPVKRKLRSNLMLIRPVIDFRKDELINYAKIRNLQWVEDETNALMYYTRNKIRHELLPHLEKEYSQGIFDVITRTVKLFCWS
jgi:tRNA(Ile)-lysidine synthetase-like protein